MTAAPNPQYTVHVLCASDLDVTVLLNQSNYKWYLTQTNFEMAGFASNLQVFVFLCIETSLPRCKKQLITCVMSRRTNMQTDGHVNMVHVLCINMGLTQA